MNSDKDRLMASNSIDEKKDGKSFNPHDARLNTGNRPSFLLAHLQFVLFLLGWTGLALTLTLYVRDRPFRVGYREALKPFFPLHQVEVSFLVAAADATIKAAFISWCYIVSWRLIYMLLATRGATLREISFIASSLPPSLGRRRFGKHWKLSYALLVVVCLSMPAQYFSTPLLSGSIAWTPSAQRNNSAQSLISPIAGETLAWDAYNERSEERKSLVLRSAAIAIVNGIDSFHRPTFAPRRTIQDLGDVPVNSSTGSLRFPFFIADKIEWLHDLDKNVPSELLDALEDESLRRLNISDQEGLITRYTSGNMVLLRDYSWTPYSINKNKTTEEGNRLFPNATSVSQEKYIAVLVNRLEEGYSCSEESSVIFGEMGSMDLLSVSWNSGNARFTNCYAIAKVSARAGSYMFSKGRVVSRGVFEAIVDSSDVENMKNLTEMEKYQDRLTTEVFAAMPEVMLNLAVLNATNAIFWENLTGYTRDLLSLAFEATWSEMSNRFREHGSDFLAIYGPVSGVTLRVLWKPFIGWIVIVSCAILSGLVFILVEMYVESRYGVRIDLRDPVLALLRLDMSQVFPSVPSMCNSSEVSKWDQGVWLSFAHRDSVASDKHKHTHKGGQTDWCWMRTLQEVPQEALEKAPGDVEYSYRGLLST
ncbi:hypothetical protein B0T10DRAFT_571698 [Thelonectria olida]|uniref:Uncharacterized protein n=1 Tax=Thelonectria olida TaxID=1576542 RepID=A0A9P8W6R9_9HYPO|nr:hypothetical protein B0T10DRAFT_571698 [Thelonectria olida]